MESNKEKKYLTVIEASELYGFSRWGIYKAMRDGRIKFERFGALKLLPSGQFKDLTLEKHGKQYWLVKKSK